MTREDQKPPKNLREWAQLWAEVRRGEHGPQANPKRNDWADTPENRVTYFMLQFHVWFVLLSATVCLPLILMGPKDRGPIGPAIAAIVLAYNLGFAYMCPRGSRPAEEVHTMFRFARATSVLMLLPDAFLVRRLGTLEFPRDGPSRAARRTRQIIFVFVCAIPRTNDGKQRWPEAHCSFSRRMPLAYSNILIP